MITFSLSLSRILQSIYAETALHNVVCGKPTLPPALHRDHRAMLEYGVRDSFAAMCMRLLPCLVDCSPETDTNSDLLTLTLNDDVAAATSSVQASALRRLMEHVVIYDTLSRCYLNYDKGVSDDYHQRATDAAETLSTTLRMTAVPPNLSLTGAWM